MAYVGNLQGVPVRGAARPNWAEFHARIADEGRHTYTLASAGEIRQITNDLSPYSLSEGGGALGVAPIELIQVAMVATSAIRANATIVNGAEWGRNVPVIDDVANNGVVISSTLSAPEAVDPGFGLREFVPSIFASGPLNISRAILQDSPPAMANLVFIAGQRLGRVQNLAWTVGGFPGYPNGIVEQATVGVTTASPTTIAIDEVLQLIGSINAYYRPRAKLMMNTSTWTALVQAKDGNGQYLWKLSGLSEIPIAYNDHMPNIAAGSIPVLYGDFSTFVVSEAGVISTQVMVEKRAEFFENVLEIFQPADGILADPAGQAVAALQMASS